MYAQQRTFLINSKVYASHRTRGLEGSITSYNIKLSAINDLSDIVRYRIAEEMASQGFIEVTESRRGRISKFKLTETGLIALDEGLRKAGRAIPSINFNVDEDFKRIITLLIEEIKNNTIENKEIMLEIAQNLKEESEKAHPKKNVIATMLGILFKGITLSADVSAILSISGLKAEEFIDFTKNIFK